MFRIKKVNHNQEIITLSTGDLVSEANEFTLGKGLLFQVFIIGNYKFHPDDAIHGRFQELYMPIFTHHTFLLPSVGGFSDIHFSASEDHPYLLPIDNHGTCMLKIKVFSKSICIYKMKKSTIESILDNQLFVEKIIIPTKYAPFRW